ncbi:MAG: hypothetical protein V4687_03925 [Bacteroidota bacterium]
MSFLNTLISEVGDGDLQERLQERIELIQHKIKFMDPVSVLVLDANNNPVTEIGNVINEVGGVMQSDVVTSRVLIYVEQGQSALHLMGTVPALLNTDWPAVEYNRVYLWDDEAAFGKTAEALVNAAEDLAEMLYPGYFVFGNEGKTWISFKTK